MDQYAQYANPSRLIHPTAIADILHDAAYQVIDMQPLDEYRKQHLEGAINIQRDEIESSSYPYPSMGLERDELERLFQNKGIRQGKKLVIYDGRAGYNAARLWWLLALYGFHHVQMIDGGIQGLTHYNIPLNEKTEAHGKGDFKFTKEINPEINATIEEIESGLEDANTVLLDTREFCEYSGEEIKTGASRGGRIPNSQCINYKEAIGADFCLKSYDELMKIYGHLDNKKVIPYCHAGVRSAFTTFVLKEILGFKNIKNYDGSWIEWSYFKDKPLENDSYDLIIIGGGSAGLTAASEGARLGKKIALIEKEKSLGGDCLHYGCVPSKALIAAAKKNKTFEEVKNEIIKAQETIQKHDDIRRFEALGVDVFIGRGRMLTSHMVTVNEKTKLQGKHILIATGSSPRIVNIAGIDQIQYYTNETIFTIPKLPKQLAVIGGGPIGCEIAQAFANMGAEVTIIEYTDSILNREDEEVKEFMTGLLSRDINILTNASVTLFKPLGDGINIQLQQGQQKRELMVDSVFLAAGRKNNIEDMGLDHVGVAIEKNRILVDQQLKTSVDHIFAAGDVTGMMPFTHGAAYEAKLIIGNLFRGENYTIDYSRVAWVTFTDHEVYHIGLTEKEALERDKEAIVVKVDLKQIDRFIADGTVEGFAKVICTREGHILGAHGLGKGAGEWMQPFSILKALNLSMKEILKVVVPYPTHGAVVERLAVLFDRELKNK